MSHEHDVDVPDEIKEKVEARCESANISLDEGRSKYMDVLGEVEEQIGDDLPDERKANIAFRTFNSDIVSQLSDGSEEINFVCYGHNGIQQQPHRNDDGQMVDENMNPVDDWQEAAKYDVLNVYGVQAIEGEGKVQVTVQLDSTDGVDLDHAARVCTFGEGIQLRAAMYEVDELSSAFRGYSTAQTEVEAGVYEDVPEDEESRIEWLRELADDAEISNITASLSATEKADNGNEYTIANGVDVKCITGDIVDYYKDDVNGTYIYTILDESAMDAEDYEGTNLMGESQRTPGFTAWATAQSMQYGEGTHAEFYGSVEESNEDGRITMSIYGVNPIFARPLEEEDEDEGGDNTETMTL